MKHDRVNAVDPHTGAKCCKCGERATIVHVYQSATMAAPGFYYFCGRRCAPDLVDRWKQPKTEN